MKPINWMEIFAGALIISSAIGLLFLFIGAPIVELISDWGPNESPGIVAMVSAFGGSFVGIFIAFWLASKA